MHTASQQALEAQAAARRLEADLADLSGAYNSLEQHAFEAEAQQHALQQQVAQLRSQLAQAAGGWRWASRLGGMRCRACLLAR